MTLYRPRKDGDKWYIERSEGSWAEVERVPDLEFDTFQEAHEKLQELRRAALSNG